MKTFYRTIARDPPCRNVRKINAKFLPRPISKRSVRKVGGISFYHSPLCRRADVAIPSRFIYRPIILSRSSRFFTSPHFSDKALGFFSKDSFSLLPSPENGKIAGLQDRPASPLSPSRNFLTSNYQNMVLLIVKKRKKL